MRGSGSQKVKITTFILSLLFGYYIGTFFHFETTPTKNLRPETTKRISSREQPSASIFSHNLDTFENSLWTKLEKKKVPEHPHLYVITPTKRSTKQLPDLIRTAQALYPVRSWTTWLIYEDSEKTLKKYPEHLKFLRKHLKEFMKVMKIHLNWTSNPDRKTLGRYLRPKGVQGRLDGIAFVRKNGKKSDVVYLADDDNAYDCELFKEILTTKGVSAWPVGLVTHLALSSPIVDKNGRVIGIHDGWIVNRKYPMDFAGFAVSARLLIENPKVSIPYVISYGETGFLSQLGVPLEDFEILAKGATEVLAFHTSTSHISYMYSKQLLKILEPKGFLQNTNVKHLHKEYQVNRIIPEPRNITKKAAKRTRKILSSKVFGSTTK